MPNSYERKEEKEWSENWGNVYPFTKQISMENLPGNSLSAEKDEEDWGKTIGGNVTQQYWRCAHRLGELKRSNNDIIRSALYFLIDTL